MNLLDFKAGGETAFIFSPHTPLLFTNRSLYIYTVPIGLRNNCAEDPQLFYSELAVFSTLVINSGSGWEVPGGLEQLLWKSGSIYSWSCTDFASDNTRSLLLVWLSLCLLLCRHSCELQWQDALWRSNLLPDCPTDPCPVRNSHFCHCRNRISMWENHPPRQRRLFNLQDNL